MINQLNYQLLKADFYSYYPAPKFWFRCGQGWRWGNESSWLGKFNGFLLRFWKIGFGWHIGSGCYCGPYGHNWGSFHWVLFWYQPYDEWLENGGF